MKTLNEIYLEILKDIWQNGIEILPRKMKCKELLAYKFVLNNPKDRIIAIPELKTNVNYAETEFNWYNSGTNSINYNELIKKIWTKYSNDGVTAESGYGAQIFGNYKYININQWYWVLEELKCDRDSRRAVININMPQNKDFDSKDIPCTMFFQVFIRNDKLYWITNMRSNDVYKGLRNDVYCFTKLQERMANELNVGLGDYIHIAGSMHLYEEDYEKVKKIL